MKDLIKKLSEMRAVSGFEHRINREIQEMLLPYCDEVGIDALGNVIGVKYCGIERAKKLLLEAHIDEIGLMVKNIDENGFITVVNVGGVDTRILPAMEVIIHGKRDIKGVIGAKPPHIMSEGESEKAVKMEDLAIDTGLMAEEVKRLVSVGDSITFFTEAKALADGQLTGKSLDDRASVAALIKVMENLSDKQLTADIYVVLATKEEVGGFGAMTATFSIVPDFAIAIDVCHGITPDNSYDAYEVGDGAIITCGPNIHPAIFERLVNTAKKHNIKFKIDVDGGNTGTDAWQIQVVKEGIPTGLLSIPLKYMHTLVETIKVSDVEAVCDLVTAFADELSEEEWICC
ncbi:MAG: M20/M25/M40 family metallo-hydrolase [Firmicutes bacterium]|nr:M20/M25/M40 family metallo-hydrolase [Bacillota bacterium]